MERVDGGEQKPRHQPRGGSDDLQHRFSDPRFNRPRQQIEENSEENVEDALFGDSRRHDSQHQQNSDLKARPDSESPENEEGIAESQKSEEEKEERQPSSSITSHAQSSALDDDDDEGSPASYVAATLTLIVVVVIALLNHRRILSYMRGSANLPSSRRFARRAPSPRKQ